MHVTMKLVHSSPSQEQSISHTTLLFHHSVYGVTVWIPTTSAQSDHLQQDSNIKLIGGEGGRERGEKKKKNEV